ncbi:OsmC family protein [Paenibacillus allorhizosphaerae]|uniref:OsmC family protein n=1 Tax=Paenibacillus allorhizosphaerae TaxID=2849866 RepID=A0ABM8VFT1_9BACL|nr:OsmC family protein [Paenibacillus allorhizosphaerae]CAG7635977.1 hypothetical protein PAECIP111802_02202 [Paenibacillus allorhizosphaerae]
MVISKNGNENYTTEIFNGTETICSDVTKEKGGSGQHFRPHDLIEAGFASCLNITTRMVLDSMNLGYEDVTVQVDLDRSSDARTIFNYRIDIAGELDEETKRVVVNKVMNCPVKKTLSKPLEFRMA